MNTSRPRSILVALAAMAALAACGSDGDSDGGTDSGTDSSTPTSSTEAGSATLALTGDGWRPGSAWSPPLTRWPTWTPPSPARSPRSTEGPPPSVDQWYAGDEAATVTVESPSKDLGDLLMAVDFEEGTSYLRQRHGWPRHAVRIHG